MFIALKTEDGTIKGKISFYCKSLNVTRQGFHNYLKYKDQPWKYQPLADAMLEICAEDECNDTYGRIRMHQALQLKQPDGIDVPSERTVSVFPRKANGSFSPCIVIVKTNFFKSK